MARYAELAQELAHGFTRLGGDNPRVIIRDDKHAETLRNMVFAVNGDLYHDDAYAMVAETLQQIADTDPGELMDTERDGLIEIYTQPLMDWLARNWTLADDMKSEYGDWPETLSEIASATQDYAYSLVLGAIEANWPTCDDETEWETTNLGPAGS